MLTDESKEFIIDKGSEHRVRRHGRCVGPPENFIEDPLSEELLKGEFQGKDTITVRVREIGTKNSSTSRAPLEKRPPSPSATGAATDGGTNGEEPAKG